MFLNFWSIILFLLGLEVVTIASVNCKTSFISYMRCTLGTEFKVVDEKKKR